MYCNYLIIIELRLLLYDAYKNDFLISSFSSFSVSYPFSFLKGILCCLFLTNLHRM